MDWSRQQQEALDAVARWITNPTQPTFRMFGYAGTGKTTLAKHLASGIDGPVYFMAYTGKAAHVLKKAGCFGATTIHSLIYQPKDKSREHLRQLQLQLGDLRKEDPQLDNDLTRKIELEIDIERRNLQRPMFQLKMDSEIRDASLLVVDESSMLDEYVARDLLSFDIPMLLLGDPAQLPPVKGAGFFTAENPDVMLTDIHRQAKDNPIIQMATTVRQGGRLQKGDYGESSVIPWSSVTPEIALAADQVLVGKNKTRFAMNKRLRQLKGFNSALPLPGDRVVCLKNDHELGLLNGATYVVQESHENDSDTLMLSVRCEDRGSLIDCEAYRQPFLGEELNWPDKEIKQFDYACAMTTHKAQGSQWDSVLVFDESSVFRGDARKWLYTAITRAANKVVVAQ